MSCAAFSDSDPPCHCRGLRAGRATHGQVFVVRQGSALEGRVAPYLVEDGEHPCCSRRRTFFCRTLWAIAAVAAQPQAVLWDVQLCELLPAIGAVVRSQHGRAVVAATSPGGRP